MHLFIDTNVLLSFFHVSSDDLEELKKLVVLLGQKKAQLYVPVQVKMEFRRNREAKVADALRRFRLFPAHHVAATFAKSVVAFVAHCGGHSGAVCCHLGIWNPKGANSARR